MFDCSIKGNLNDYAQGLNLPNEDDLKGAAAALTRLQKTYQLDVAQMSHGKIKGVQYRFVHFDSSIL